ncbi:hypothetical protein ASESINO_26 [Erwinia phage vB_EamM_Asesino]|uniref:Uncharacterized protein n=1 Tax=Erwinia phage vB_EamM_Asesino TaxID=1883370 RepID=A0A1B2I9U0_9CAUD|nr:hypothetical protein ASESINO_26 [Erwinia phage vB_EamM_Asesino]ANZ48039.1 hypothetical protein ASESINO_26 [Erwinia phage vB_EamM_Asesino]
MTRVFFNFRLDVSHILDTSPELTLLCMQELIFPGLHDLPSEQLSIAERYFGSEAWYTISALGPYHRNPFLYNNGVVQTWSEFTSSQMRFIIASGAQWNHPHMLPLCG